MKSTEGGNFSANFSFAWRDTTRKKAVKEERLERFIRQVEQFSFLGQNKFFSFSPLSTRY